MNNIYHPDIYQFNTPVSSYWEDISSENLQIDKLKKDTNSEIVVIGGGYTGLLCAINLIKNNKNKENTNFFDAYLLLILFLLKFGQIIY